MVSGTAFPERLASRTRMSAWTCRQSVGKAAQKIVPPHPRTPCWKGLRADFEEKREPVSDIDAVVVDSLKRSTPNGVRQASWQRIGGGSLPRGKA